MLALVGLSCLDDSPVGPVEPSVRLALRAQVVNGEGRVVEIGAFYMRGVGDGVSPVELPTEPNRVVVAPGTVQVPVSIRIRDCLADEARVGAAELAGRCTFSIRVRLLDAEDVVLDSVTVEAGDAGPGETVRPPVVTIGVTYALSVAGAGNGEGVVTSTPAAIDCAISAGATSGACGATLNEGTVVTLTATPGTTSSFAGWSGACQGTGTCAVTLAQARSVTATFTLLTFGLTVAGDGSLGSGRVTSEPAGVDCTITNGIPAGACTATYDAGTVVTLAATASQGSTFEGWGDTCAGTGTCAVTMSAARTTIAHFNLNSYYLDVLGDGDGSGTVTGGADCTISAGAATGTCRVGVNHGQVATLIATPGPNSTFTGWSGACSGTGDCVVTMDQARSVTATFTLVRHTLTIGGAGTGSGALVVSALDFACRVESGVIAASECSTITLPHGAVVTLDATPDVGSAFIGWGGACAGTGRCSVTMDQARAVTATFAFETFALTLTGLGDGGGTISSSPSGIDCTIVGGAGSGVCARGFTYGTVVTLTAVASSNSAFAGWGGACSGTGACTVTIDQARSVVATFSRTSYLLAVSLSGSGQGRVTSAPAGIDCRRVDGTTIGTCEAAFPSGTTVTLSAEREIGSSFDGWGVHCSGTQPCEAQMYEDVTVTGVFRPLDYLLRLDAAGAGGGTVTSSPPVIDCVMAAGATLSGTCSAMFAEASVVTLVAAPAANSVFAGWSGACSGTGACTVTMDQARVVTATFEIARYDVVLTLVGDGSGTVTSDPAGIACTLDDVVSGTCTARFPHGTAVTLTVTPGANDTFEGWAGACTGTGGCQLMVTSAVSVTASFGIALRTLTLAGAGTGTGTVQISALDFSCRITAGVIDARCANPSIRHGTTITLFATPDAGTTFAGWGGACTGAGTCVVTMDQARSVTATFTTLDHTLSVSGAGDGDGTLTSSPGGISCTISAGVASGTCTASFPHGTPVTLTAASATGHAFGGWSGACSGTSSCQLTMTSAVAVAAAFIANRYALQVTGAGAGSGHVTSTPAGADCQIAAGIGSGSCLPSFRFGTVVTLAAAPANGSVFAGWSGACSGTGSCAVTMDQARNVTATFTFVTHVFTLTLGGAGDGRVTSDPAGIDCVLLDGASSGTCSASFVEGTVVTLNPVAAAGSTFEYWLGDCGDMSTCRLTMDGPRQVSGTFGPARVALAVSGRAGTGRGTVTSTPAGIDCVILENGTAAGTCDATFVIGTVVTLAATPATGGTFAGWSGACSGSGTCQLTMNESLAVSAGFGLTMQPLSISGAGTGDGSVASNPGGIACAIAAGVAGSGCNAAFLYGTTVTLTPSPASGSSFSGWSGACAGAGTCTVTMDQARAATATFTRTMHTVTVVPTGGTGDGRVTSTPAGIACTFSADGLTGACSAQFPAGTRVTFAAEALGSESMFSGWSGACAGTGGCALTLDGNVALGALFERTYTLTLSLDGAGSGRVTSDPAGIDCSIADSELYGTCTARFAAGTEVTLEHEASASSAFTYWRGDCGEAIVCTLTMDRAHAVLGGFGIANRWLTITSALGNGAGTITSDPAGIRCDFQYDGSVSGECSAIFEHGTTVLLSTRNGYRSIFTGWGGACTGTEPQCQLAMTQDLAVVGRFDAALELAIYIEGDGAGRVVSTPAGIDCQFAGGGSDGTCSTVFPQGTIVALSATPAAGSTFDGWAGDCAEIDPCRFTMNQGVSVIARFSAVTHPLTIGAAGDGTGSVVSTPGGIDCAVSSGTTGTGTCVANFPHGTAVTLDVNLSQSSALAAWGGDCTGAGTCTVVMDQPRHVIADLAIVRYRLFVSGSGSKGSGRIVSSPAGIDCSITTGSASGECVGYFDIGKPVTLTETPASGSAFGGWSGGGCGGTSSSCTVTMTDDLSVTAIFNPGFRLTLALNGTGGGRVTSSPAGIDCERVDNITRGTCAADFSSGADIVLTATATYGSFGGWSGACAGTTPTCALRIVGTTSVGGTFTGTATLAITGTGGSGIVRSQPGLTPAIDCTLTNGVAAATGCSASYPVGTTIVLTATTVEGSGYSFGAWTGWCSGYEPTCTVSNIATSVTQRVGFNFNRCAIETSLPLGGQLSGSLTTSDCQVGEEIVRYRDSYSVTVPSQAEFLVTLNASWGGKLVSVPNAGAYWYSIGTTTSQTILVPAGRYVFHVMNQELNRVGNYTIASRTGGLGVCEHIRTTFGLTAASRTLDGNKCQYVASDRGTQAPAEPFSIYVPSGKTLRVTVVASDHEPLIEFRDGRGPDNVFDSALLATSSAGPRGFSASLSMVGGGLVKVWVTTRGTTSGSPYTITIDP